MQSPRNLSASALNFDIQRTSHYEVCSSFNDSLTRRPVTIQRFVGVLQLKSQDVAALELCLGTRLSGLHLRLYLH